MQPFISLTVKKSGATISLKSLFFRTHKWIITVSVTAKKANNIGYMRLFRFSIITTDKIKIKKN